MNFFFEYIYYRLTKLFFKRDGRRGFTGIAFISLMQGLIAGAFLLQISKWTLTEEIRALCRTEIGYLAVLITIFILIYNYKKYNDMYNKCRYYWKDETKEIWLLKGFYVFLTFLVPLALILVVGVKWDK